jgi:hypothetical protein
MSTSPRRSLVPEAAAQKLRSLDLSGAVDDPLIAPRGCWTLDRLAARFPAAKFLVVIESPAATVAGCFRSEEEDDPHSRLELWRAGAARLLQHVQRHRERTCVVDWHEATLNVEGLRAVVARFAGDAMLRPQRPVESTEQALPALFGRTVVAGDGPSQRLYEQLSACCEILPGAVPLSAAQEESALHAAGIREWRSLRTFRAEATEALRQGEAKLAQLQAAETAVRRQCGELQGELEQWYLRAHSAQDALAQQERQHAQLQTALTGAEKERGRLATELQRAQEELRRVQEELRRVQAELEQEFLTRQVERTRGQRQERLQLELTEAKRQLDGQVERQQAELGHLRAELEHYYLEWRYLQATAGPVAKWGLRAAACEIGASRDEGPHRELALCLRDVRSLEARFERMNVRLVEHNGMPGLVIFAEPGSAPLFAAWQEMGREQDSPYMIFIPQDQRTSPLFDRMGTQDRIALESLVNLVTGMVGEHAQRLSSRWSAIAARLRNLLAAQPRRFRFDGIDVEVPTEPSRPMHLVFRRVLFGARLLDRLRVEWNPRTPSAIVLHAEDGEPPLLQWPVDDVGRWATSFTLPLGAGAPAPQQRSLWRALPEEDRGLLLGLLDALPAVADSLSEQQRYAGMDRPAIASAATQPLREAVRMLRGSRVRRVARTVLGRDHTAP